MVDAFRRDFSIFEFIVSSGRISSHPSWVSESNLDFEFSDPLVSATLNVVSSRTRSGYCRRSVCTDGGRVSSNSSVVLRSPFAFVRRPREWQRLAFLEADEGPTRERVGNRRSWMIAAFVRARRRRCREIRTFQPDMAWHYPAGEERNGGALSSASPVFPTIPPSKGVGKWTR